MKKPMVDTMMRSKFDDLYTPAEGVYPILKYLPRNCTVWEPCDSGNSEISRILRENGHPVISTDIKTGTDFLTDDIDLYYDIIVTNPPYSLKDKFLERCYRHNKPFAMLLPLTALEGVKRSKMFNDNGGISVVVLDRRLDFTKRKSTSIWFNTSWFMWNIIENSKLVFEEVLYENK